MCDSEEGGGAAERRAGPSHASGEGFGVEAIEAYGQAVAAGLLDPDEEDALRQELAQIEAEIGSEAETATAPEPEKGDRADRVPARTALPDPLTEEEALSRLMAEAETKMEAPEQSRRRDEFARMRAAVAARQADGSASHSTRIAERFAGELARRSGLSVHRIDEHLSSHAAAESLRDRGQATDVLDAEAARIILETWLSEQSS